MSTPTLSVPRIVVCLKGELTPREIPPHQSATRGHTGQLESNDFYLGGLDKPTDKIAPGFVKDINGLLDRMQKSAEPFEPIDLAPVYNIVRLELALRDASDGFIAPWRGRLGLEYYEGVGREHWTRV